MATDPRDNLIERIVRAEADACPSREEMDAYVMGKATPGQSILIERHIESGACARCAEALAAAREAVSLMERGPMPAAGTGPRRRPRLAVAAALATLALAAFVLNLSADRTARRSAGPRPSVLEQNPQTMGPDDSELPAVVKNEARWVPETGEWLLTWEPVVGAERYVVTVVGPDGARPHTVTDTKLAVPDVPKPGANIRWDVRPVMEQQGTR